MNLVKTLSCKLVSICDKNGIFMNLEHSQEIKIKRMMTRETAVLGNFILGLVIPSKTRRIIVLLLIHLTRFTLSPVHQLYGMFFFFF
jgi:hypothetical protein